MDVRVLGPVEASVDERPVAIGAGKPRALLAMLALNAGSPVSAERLVDGLWGEEPPATAAKMVQVYVSQLRKALAASGDDAEIVTRGRGYELRLGRGGVDVRRFERLVAEGAPRAALALWRGPALDDVAGEPFAALEIRRLEDLRLAAVELAIEDDLAAGRHVEVVGELEALVAEEPLRERLHAQRMLALYRCGRQADALDAYRQARTALVEAIGVEPGPELRRLHEAILRQDPALEPPLVEVVELPPELDAGTPLVGREAELAALREHWRHAHDGAGRIVLIVAERGMGKTRLAAELAGEVHRDRGAVLFASGAGAPEAALAALDSLRAPRRPSLLVLDDVDQAAAEIRAAVDELARALAALPILVLATAEDDVVPADATLALGPLGADGVRAVAQLYAGPHADSEPPVERLVAESGGVPQRVHRAVSEWARTEAARRLGATAERAAAERTGLRATEDDLAGDVVQLQAVRERAERQDARPEVVACPFKGLASFDVDDGDVFFGRERLVAEMVARIAGAPLVGIVGPSGSGKSSALRAGLLAALREDVIPGSKRWALALLRPGEHPLAALEQATAEAARQGRLVVAVDQFEEVFTACRDEHERRGFVDALVACARDPRRRALVLLAIRADFYGRCASNPELWRLLGANQVPVGPMRRDELRRAIELPARRAGLHVEPELVDALIADVEGEPGALPLLSTSLLELWQHRDGRRLHMSAYEHAGGVHGAVARLAERTYERLEPERRDVARHILLRLAGGEGDAVVRQRVPLAELAGRGEDGVGEVLAVLADDRLITVGEGEVEVAHEALLREWPRLRGWLEEDAQGRGLQLHLRAAAREWDEGGRDAGELYRGARLASALDSIDHDSELNAIERAFLAESRTASERSQRRLRAVLAGVAALLVLAVIAGLVALDQRGTAREHATAAEAQRLGARALLEDDLDRALLLARQGVALDDTMQTRGNLLAALVRSPAAIGVMRLEGARLLVAALSPDERTLVVGNDAGKVFVLDARSRRRVTTLEPTPNGAAIWALAYSPDGSHLAVGHTTVPGDAAGYPDRWRAVVTLLDARTHRVVRRLALPRQEAFGGVQFSPDGRTLGVTLFPDDRIASFTRFDARTGRRISAPLRVDHGHRLTPNPFQLWPHSIAIITNDGRLVVGADDRITLRDASKPSRVLPGGSFPISGGASRVLATAYALSRDDRKLAIGGENGSVRFLDLNTGELRTASGRHRDAVTDARFSPDGRWLVTTAVDGGVILWDVRQAAVGETLSAHTRSASSPQITRDGKTLYTASLDGTALVWDLVGARRLGRPLRAGSGGLPGNFPRYAVSSDGRLLAHGQGDGAISIVDLRTLTRREPFPVVTTGNVEGIGFVPGSHLMVVGGNEGFLALVDADRGQVVRHMRGHRGRMYTPGISADGRLLATGSDDETVRLWSLPDGRSRGVLHFPHSLNDAQLSPDGRRLTVGVLNRDIVPATLEVWDVPRRRRVTSVRPADGIDSARFSPDGGLLAVTDPRGRTQVWSTATWKPVTRAFAGHAGTILGAIGRDNRTLATGSADGTLQLWDIQTEQAIGAALPGVAARWVVPLFTPDGTRLIAGHETGRAYVWDVRPESLSRHACQVAGRRLTRAEWAQFLPGRDYDPAC